jgi:hypothetical protein
VTFFVASVGVNRKQKYSADAWEMLRMFHPENGKRGVVETNVLVLVRPNVLEGT